MTQSRCRALSVGLCILLFFASSGCVEADDSNPGADQDSSASTHMGGESYETKTGALNNTAKFRLTAEVVPGGHVSVSNHFVLSGSVDPGLTKTTSSSQHFRLTGKPMTTDP